MSGSRFAYAITAGAAQYWAEAIQDLQHGMCPAACQLPAASHLRARLHERLQQRSAAAVGVVLAAARGWLRLGCGRALTVGRGPAEQQAVQVVPAANALSYRQQMARWAAGYLGGTCSRCACLCPSLSIS
jgi:hypothetical protein